MQASMKVQVLAAKRFKMDNGYAATTLYCVGAMVDEQDKFGKPPMKLSGEFDVLDQLRGNIPGEMELNVEFRQGSKDKLEQYVLSATPVDRPAASQKPAQTAQAK